MQEALQDAIHTYTHLIDHKILQIVRSKRGSALSILASRECVSIAHTCRRSNSALSMENVVPEAASPAPSAIFTYVTA